MRLHSDWLRPVSPISVGVFDVAEYRYCCMNGIVL